MAARNTGLQFSVGLVAMNDDQFDPGDEMLYGDR